MRKRGLCCRPVSVCLSVFTDMLVHSINTAEVIVKLLCRPGSPIIIVFESQHRYPIQRGDLFSRATKYKGWKNFAIFD